MAKNNLNKIQYTSEADNEEFRRVWNTQKVDDCVEMMEKYGESPGGNPFVEKDISLRAADIVFEYTEEEIEEIKRCANDVIYFANKYCRAMTDDGIVNITLRDYQERVLKSFQDNRFSIFLASRQIGKCINYNTMMTVRINGKVIQMHIGDLYYTMLSNNRRLTLLEKIKWICWKIYSKIPYNYESRGQTEYYDEV